VLERCHGTAEELTIPWLVPGASTPDEDSRAQAITREVGMIKSTPQKIIVQGTDWRFLTELTRELKG